MTGTLNGPVATVIFDLDGTLTDPLTGITGCMRHALDVMGVAAPPPDHLARFIGPPLRESFASLLQTSDSARIEAAVAYYRARYRQTGMLQNELYPGIPELLHLLHSRGLRLFVATSKLRTLAELIAEHFSIAEWFSRIYGAEEGGRFEDKRELLPHLVTVEGLAAEECVMVGDRRYDVEAGKVVGCRTVGVSWGYGAVDELAAAGADFICASPGEVAALDFLKGL